MDKAFFALGSLSGLLAVALGAFGAHALKGRLDVELLATFEVGVRYQMYRRDGKRMAVRRRHRGLLGQPVCARFDRRALAGGDHAARRARAACRLGVPGLGGVERMKR